MPKARPPASKGRNARGPRPGSPALEAALAAVERIGPHPVPHPSPGVAETQAPFAPPSLPVSVDEPVSPPRKGAPKPRRSEG
jgi:hypothetical protein